MSHIGPENTFLELGSGLLDERQIPPPPADEKMFLSRLGDQIFALLKTQVEENPANYKDVLATLWSRTCVLPNALDEKAPMQDSTRNWIIFQYSRNPLAFFDDLLRIANETKPVLNQTQLAAVAILLSNVFASEIVRSYPSYEDDLAFALMKAWEDSTGHDRPRRRVIEHVLLHNPLLFWNELKMLMKIDSTPHRVKMQISAVMQDLQTKMNLRTDGLLEQVEHLPLPEGLLVPAEEQKQPANI